jgi:hypothetical protein
MHDSQAAPKPKETSGGADLGPERQGGSGLDPSPNDGKPGWLTTALRAMQALDQVTQPEGGLKAKVDMKQRLVAPELA